jgi:glycosyltransferase involved in cell wall biosynthesis
MKHKIISTYHHSFAGGSKNTSRLLNYLSNNGCTVDAYFFETPQFFSYTESNIVNHTIDSQNINSEVIDTTIIKNYSAANQIIEDLRDKKDYILFGANLFPYCNILHDVKSQIVNLTGVNPKLIIHPVGSDLWQIGPQIKSRVKWLLDNPLVDTILTYSNCFVNEIKDYYNIEKEIHVLPPVIEKERFYPISKAEIIERKIQLGFDEEDFIIHHHSSMRKIKSPETILDISMKVSQLTSRKCILIMAGPIPQNEIKLLNISLTSLSENSYFKYKSQWRNLIILWTGIESSVQYLLQISDVELNTSLHDSFNLSLMEAMACGIPVVTSDVVGIKEHILLANAGFCFPTTKLSFDDLNVAIQNDASKNIFFDIDYAVNAVLSLAHKNSITANMGENGAKYALNKFSFENASKEFHKHLC